MWNWTNRLNKYVAHIREESNSICKLWNQLSSVIEAAFFLYDNMIASFLKC